MSQSVDHIDHQMAIVAQKICRMIILAEHYGIVPLNAACPIYFLLFFYQRKTVMRRASFSKMMVVFQGEFEEC
jgi:hypothetical protein